MKTNYYKLALLAGTFFVFACTHDKLDVLDEQNPAEHAAQQDPFTPSEINAQIRNAMETTGAFDWKDASDRLLWSAVYHGDNILTIGYGSHGDEFRRNASASQSEIKDKLLEVVLEHENVESKKENVLVYEDKMLTLFDVKVQHMETISRLREQGSVRYLEPGGYRFFTAEVQKSSGSGCGFESETVSTSDYTLISPNAKMPWNFNLHKIPQAWSYSTGSGITIGVIDTGTSPNQSLLGSNFNDGYSSNRYIQKYGTYVDSWWPWSTKTDGPNDKCGHGTSMASAAAAPRNDNGLPVGVAYNANLVTYRAAKNVVLDGYHEQKGVANAFTALANRSDVKIISMSMGHIFSVGRITDAVRYAYGRGKLIFCAGGTSTNFTNFTGVIFPAWMSETVAVTGVEEGSGYSECDTCHKGSEIDFTVVMERSGTNKHQPVLSYYDNQNDYVGGSSVATATTAGIAALVWAKNPGWSRSQVLNKMVQSADLYPNRSSSYGWGNVDALKAVQ